MPANSARKVKTTSAVEAETTERIEATVAYLQEGATKAAAGFEATQAKMKAEVDQAMKTAEEIVASDRGSVEAFMTSGRIWATGVQDLTRQLASAAQASVDDSISAFKALTSVKSLKDAFELQSSFARSVLERSMAESDRLTDMSFKLTEQALGPITGRVTATVEKSAKAAPRGVETSQPTNLTGIIRTVLAVCSRWDISDDLGTVILGSADPNFMSGLRSGTTSLDTRDMQDRARLFFDIYEGVYGLFRNADAERNWISVPREDFDGKSVMDLMTEGSQRNLIRALAFVDYVNGR